MDLNTPYVGDFIRELLRVSIFFVLFAAYFSWKSGGARDGAVTTAIRLRRIDGFCHRQNPMS
jgi:hypothetical protein